MSVLFIVDLIWVSFFPIVCGCGVSCAFWLIESKVAQEGGALYFDWLRLILVFTPSSIQHSWPLCCWDGWRLVIVSEYHPSPWSIGGKKGGRIRHRWTLDFAGASGRTSVFGVVFRVLCVIV